MEIINIGAENTIAKSHLLEFIKNNAINMDNLHVEMYEACCELFDKNFGKSQNEINYNQRNVTQSTDNLRQALIQMIGTGKILLIEKSQQGQSLFNAIKYQKSYESTYILIEEIGCNINIIPIYFSFVRISGDKMYESEFEITYKECNYVIDSEIKAIKFGQDGGFENSKASYKMINLGPNSLSEVDDSTGNDNSIFNETLEYSVNYNNKTDSMYGKNICKIVELALKESNVPREIINSKKYYDNVIDSLTCKYGNPVPNICNYEINTESIKILSTELNKSQIVSTLSKSTNRMDVHKSQATEVLINASQAGFCLEISVIYLKFRSDKKQNGFIFTSTIEKNVLHYEKFTYTLPRYIVQRLASKLI